MQTLFQGVDTVIRDSRVAELETQVAEFRHAIQVLSKENKNLRSLSDKAQHAGIIAWMEKYAKLEAEFLAYRQKCNQDGTAPPKFKKKAKKKSARKLRLTEQWSIQHDANPKGIFND